MASNAGTIDHVRKKLTYTHDLISTSYHEAGHTIYALLHFTKVSSVVVFENKKNKRIEGFCYYQSPVDLSEVEDVDFRKHLVTYEIGLKYAGLTSEKYYFKTISGSDKFPMVLKDGSSDDTLSAAALINTYELVPSGKKRYLFKKKMIHSVLLELQNNWEAITLVAHALFKKKKLSYAALKKILCKETENKDFWKSKFKVLDRIFAKNRNINENELKTILV